jgi:hypothetical protein
MIETIVQYRASEMLLSPPLLDRKCAKNSSTGEPVAKTPSWAIGGHLLHCGAASRSAADLYHFISQLGTPHCHIPHHYCNIIRHHQTPHQQQSDRKSPLPHLLQQSAIMSLATLPAELHLEIITHLSSTGDYQPSEPSNAPTRPSTTS